MKGRCLSILTLTIAMGSPAPAQHGFTPATTGNPADTAARRPNIIFILSDDHA